MEKVHTVADKDLLAWAGGLFTDLGETMKDATQPGASFAGACRDHGFEWSSVRRLIMTETLQQCRLGGDRVQLGEIARETPEPCSELYKAVFGSLGKNVELPEDYEESVNAVLGKLSEREGKIVRMRYGIDGDAPMTLEEIAETFRVTRERVRQLEKRAISKLSRYPYREILRRGVCQYEVDQARKRAEREARMIDAERKRQEALWEYERMRMETEKAAKSQRDMLREEVDIPIECMNLSTRSYNCLHRVGVTTVGEVLTTTDNELRKIRGLGETCLTEIRVRCNEVLMRTADGGAE